MMYIIILKNRHKNFHTVYNAILFKFNTKPLHLSSLDSLSGFGDADYQFLDV